MQAALLATRIELYPLKVRNGAPTPQVVNKAITPQKRAVKVEGHVQATENAHWSWDMYNYVLWMAGMGD